MKDIFLFFCFIGVLLISFGSCEEEIAPPRSDWGYNYFPLKVGMEWLYEMDSITLIPQVGGIFFDSVRLSVREVLVDTLRDLEQQLWYRGERYDRSSDSLPWRFRQTFLLRRDGQRAYRMEDNLTFVKMTFPARKFKNWDGHAAFDDFREIDVGGQPIAIYKNWNYYYTSVDEPGIIKGVTYDSITTISGVDTDDNIVDRRFAIEKYARNVGLVYREVAIFETKCIVCCMQDSDQCFDLPWRDKAEAGFIIRQWLVE